MKEEIELTEDQKKKTAESLLSVLKSENRCCTIQIWKGESPVDYFKKTGKDLPDETIWLWGNNPDTDKVIKLLLTLYQ